MMDESFCKKFHDVPLYVTNYVINLFKSRNHGNEKPQFIHLSVKFLFISGVMLSYLELSYMSLYKTNK